MASKRDICGERWPALLSPEEAAAYLGESRSTWYEHIAPLNPPSVARIGSSGRRYIRDELVAWYQEQAKPKRDEVTRRRLESVGL